MATWTTPASIGRLKFLKMVPKKRICYGRTESLMVALLERREHHGGRKLGLG